MHTHKYIYEKLNCLQLRSLMMTNNKSYTGCSKTDYWTHLPS